MYKRIKVTKTSIERNTQYVGETIEKKVERIVNNKEPISDGAPLTYTERKDGVLPEYDIRTDRWDVAIDAMDKVTQSHQAKREEKLKAVKGGKDDTSKDQGGSEGETGGQSTQATDSK